MPRTSKPSPNTRPQKPAPWPKRALGVLENVQSLLSDITKMSNSIDRQTSAIYDAAVLGADAVQNGNLRLAAEIFNNIQQRTATQRHANATILGAAGKAAAALAAARVGEYGEG
jgi:hypothetical protein